MINWANSDNNETLTFGELKTGDTFRLLDPEYTNNIRMKLDNGGVVLLTGDVGNFHEGICFMSSDVVIKVHIKASEVTKDEL